MTSSAATTLTAKEATTTARAVPTRRMSFDESLAHLPKHFAKDGDLISSHIIAVMSSLFPDGEDFFVRSVRHYRDQITDPELTLQVAGFIGQESIHGREHRAFNDRLAELGYPTKKIERFVARAIAFRERHAPPATNLAITAALEHFTASLAETSMTDANFRALPGPEVSSLFLWHSLEEAEHKAVAFDVYRTVGGSERMRIWTMKGIRKGFVVVTGTLVILSLLRDRATYRRGVFKKSWRRFTASAFMSPELRHLLREYDQRGFHPNDRDDTDLIAHWRDELFGEDGRLNDLLVNRTASADPHHEILQDADSQPQMLARVGCGA